MKTKLFTLLPQEMSFGQLMAHIGGINLYACANASGLRSPRGPRTRRRWKLTKNTSIQFLGDSFDFGIKAASSMTPDRLDSAVGTPERHATGFEWLGGTSLTPRIIGRRPIRTGRTWGGQS